MKKKAISLMLITYMMLSLTGCKGYTEDQLSLREQGIEAIENGSYDNAIDLFNQALGLSYGKVTELELDINYYKAAAQFKGHYYDEAISTYTALIRYDEKNFAPYFLRGCVYANALEITKARADYDAAIALDKKNYELYIEIYENLHALGYDDEGYIYLTQLFELEDKSPTAKYFKGRGKYITGQFDEAETLLTEAVNKNIIDAKLYLAKLYQDRGESENAKRLLEDYAKSDGVNGEAMATLGDIELAKGEYSTALDYYETGLSLPDSGNMPQLYKGAVVALENMGRFDEAEDKITQYLVLYPDDEDAQNELIFIKTR